MLKHLFCAIGIAAIASPASAFLLTNGGLDDPGVHESDIANGWTLFEAGGANAATFASFADRTAGPGGVGLWLRSFAGSFDGDAPQFVSARLSQDVPASPGVAYTASAWFRYEANYPGTIVGGATETTLGMTFLDAGMGALGQIVFDVDAAQDNDGVWRQFFVNGIAPAGTAFVRVYAEMNDGHIVQVNPQSAFIDDFELVPSPASPMPLALAGIAAVRRRR